MTLDNMTGITEGSYTGFCKSQLITCNFVKECNGVCQFEDALKHADKTQTKNVQHTVDHDKDWIIGCIQHDGFIHTHRFDKANQIILDALSAEAKTKCVAQIKVDTEEIVRRIKEEYDITDGWIPCSERLPEDGVAVLTTTENEEVYIDQVITDPYKERYFQSNTGYDNFQVIAWMPLPKPYKGGEE